MPNNVILVLNCGSSSIKFAAFEAEQSIPVRQPLWKGKVQGIGGPAPEFDETGSPATAIELDPVHPHTAALDLILHKTTHRLQQYQLVAVAHRVVHGGQHYSQPVRVSQNLIDELRHLTPLAPLHQPFPLKAMAILLEQYPELPQFACFDTAFHHTLPQVEQLLPLPWSAWEQGVRRYGFHGLSYEYMSLRLPEIYGDLAARRTIVAHLGSGASLCALNNLESIATTMGFSALDGLMMGTRTGSLDPGALLYLMEINKFSVEEISQMLYHHSGLLGVSGLSAEPRHLQPREQDNDETGRRARLALALYVRRIVREIGALTAILGGLDLLVFTAGVGENCAFIRERVCRDLAFLGLRLDPHANENNAPQISTPDSAISVAVEATNEEWVVARHALALLS